MGAWKGMGREQKTPQLQGHPAVVGTPWLPLSLINHPWREDTSSLSVYGFSVCVQRRQANRFSQARQIAGYVELNSS